jgi:phosphate acetyltransferase
MGQIENKTFDEIQIGDTANLVRTLTKRDIDLFGATSGDMNPTHYSAADAKVHLNNERVAGHGMWAGALISAILGNQMPGAGTLYKRQDLNFKRPVYMGETLKVSVTAKEKNPDTKCILFDCLVVTSEGEEILDGTAEVVAPTQKQCAEALIVPEFMQNHSQHALDMLIEKVAHLDPVSVAVCHPCNEVSLRGPIEAAEMSLINPVLVGPEDKIKAVADECGLDISPYRIVNTEHSHASADAAVALCRSGECEALMKGSLHTDEMMIAVMHKEKGLRTARRVSHVFVMDVPAYPKPLLITDAAINIYPTLKDKVDICQNAIDLAKALDIAEPRVAILSAVETVNEKIASTLEAAALCKMADRGQIKGAILDGPLAFDNAISADAAEIKGIISPVSGQADILLVPDLEAGNMLAKQLSYLAEADAAGIVLGARVPIILTSRADSAHARLASCAVAVKFAYARRA